MMKTSSSLLYYDNGKSYSAVEVPYVIQDGWLDFTAIFILPNKDIDCIKFVTSFTMDILEEFYLNAELKDVDCQIPKFSYSSSVKLDDLLEGLGIKQLHKKADLSNMLEMKKEEDIPVLLSHACEITVDEMRTITDASADNAVAQANAEAPGNKNSPPENLIPFIADRPFLMLIRNVNSHAVALVTFFHKV